MPVSPEDIKQRLESSDSQDRTVGLVLIGRGRLHTMVDEVIERLQDDRDDEVRAMAAWTLDLIGSPETIPMLLDAMYDDAFGVRSNAGWALVHMARRILPHLVVPDVIEILKDEDHADARQMAYLVLLHIGGYDALNAIHTYWP